ncbi:PilZ domain-containing protein [Peribacillus alkalitolerans]|uniref:PilZ domain-containing protein n=1 Tax=Peribacillus alkalitolerans TaxID=1550385 RepID=UPI0013D36B75|nr:PilZ domain-containing protein [Peribacillus alkalitolerans]
MMKYKRDEPFRYQFPEPISGHFVITSIKGLLGQSKKGKIELLDISQSGCKFQSQLDIPISDGILFEISVTLNGNLIILPGKIAWKKKKLKIFEYGYSMEADEEFEKAIIAEIKEYVRIKRKEKEF